MTYLPRFFPGEQQVTGLSTESPLPQETLKSQANLDGQSQQVNLKRNINNKMLITTVGLSSPEGLEKRKERKHRQVSISGVKGTVTFPLIPATSNAGVSICSLEKETLRVSAESHTDKGQSWDPGESGDEAGKR